MEQIMRCKFILNSAEVRAQGTGKTTESGSYAATKQYVNVKFGAVWEGSNENQAKSENAIFGEATPTGDFSATIHNPVLVESLPKLVGREFYLDFTLLDRVLKA